MRSGIWKWLSVGAWFAAFILVVLLHILAFALSIPARIVGVAVLCAQKWLDELSAPKGA